MNEHTVNSLTELFTFVFDKGSAFFNSDDLFIFRGQEDSKWGLVPAIFRNYLAVGDSRVSRETPVYDMAGGISLVKIRQICEIERVIYREFFERLRAYPQIQVNRNALWEMLCIAQHFGVPTRLLDWTDNLSIAAYFSVVKSPKKNGAIWCLNATQVAAIHNLPSFRNLMDKKGGVSRIDDLPHDASFFTPRDPGIAQPIRLNDPQYGFRILQPPDMEQRIKSQGSFFTVDVTTNDYNDNEHDSHTHYDHAELCNNLLLKITIRSKSKREVKKDLEKIGTNYKQIFPDLYGIGMYLSDMREDLILKRL